MVYLEFLSWDQLNSHFGRKLGSAEAPVQDKTRQYISKVVREASSASKELIVLPLCSHIYH